LLGEQVTLFTAQDAPPAFWQAVTASAAATRPETAARAAQTFGPLRAIAAQAS
jgi:hypothetical protein